MTRAISRESCPRVGFGLGTEQGVRNVTKLWIRRAPLEKGHEFKKKKKDRKQVVVEITVRIRTFWPEVKWRRSSKVILERQFL